jgi:histidinol-phosphate/aromatic aminotransferase/cobyric acid decarboxylase-like protein/GTP:adenosylcobinamide-phosphate guanylyltransferase
MQVVIPAAGMGSRLGSHTENKTKCMVKVNGVTLIERALNILIKKDVNRIILIVGYEKNSLIDLLGDNYKGVPIVYVHNDIYDKTNNIYSVFLAKDELIKDDTILLESDLIFNENIIDLLLDNDYPSLAAVDKYQRWMDGTVIKLDENFDITSFISGRDFQFEDAEHYYKTVNIYKFSKEFLEEKYVPFLEAYSKALGDNEYYEQVLKVIALLDTKDLKALPLNGEKWYEIDDVQDLDNAEVIFADIHDRQKLLAKRYGGYWRYEDISDFCYLVNPYFPNKKFIDEMKFSFDTLIREYPSGADIQSLLAAKLFDCKKEQIVVGNGAGELISCLPDNIKKTMGLFLPTFEEYSSRFKSVKAKGIDNRNFEYDINDIIEFSKENDGFILINPDNPSGNYIPFKNVLKLIDWFEENNKVLVIDESFIDFSEEGSEASLLSSNILEKSEKLIVIKSISKSYGVPGIRLGVLASSNTSLISDIKKKIPVWNINSYGEYFLQIIGKYKKEYANSCKKIVNERNVFFEQLVNINYLRPIKSQANYILCEVDGLSAEILTEELSYKFNLLIKNCSSKLGFNGNEYVRIAVKDSYENQKMIEALIEINK